MPIDGIARPEPVNAQNLENQGGRRWQISRHETTLRGIVIADQHASSGSDSLLTRIFEKTRHGVQTTHKMCVRIERKHQRGGGGAHTLIQRRGETCIGGIGDDAACTIRDEGPGAVGRCVVDDHDLRYVGREGGESVEACADFPGRVVGHDYDCDSWHVSMRRTFENTGEAEIPSPVGIGGAAPDFALGTYQELPQ